MFSCFFCCSVTAANAAYRIRRPEELTRATNQGHHQWLARNRQMERKGGSQRSIPSWSLRDVCGSSWPDAKWSSQFNNGLVRSSLKIRVRPLLDGLLKRGAREEHHRRHPTLETDVFYDQVKVARVGDLSCQYKDADWLVDLTANLKRKGCNRMWCVAREFRLPQTTSYRL